MQYEGTPNHPMPAHNYDEFQAVFKKKIKELRQQLRMINSLQKAYTIVTQFLEHACLREAHTISLDSGGVTVSVTLNDESVLDSFATFALRLGEHLRKEHVHQTGLPTESTDTFFSISRRWYWYVGEGLQRVTLLVNIPDTGCFDYAVVKHLRSYVSEELELVKRPDRLILDHLDQHGTNLYDYIEARTSFDREEVKIICLGLSWKMDHDELLTKLGYGLDGESNALMRSEVLKVKELLDDYTTSQQNVPHADVRASTMPEDVPEDQAEQAVLQHGVSDIGEGPEVSEESPSSV